MVKMESPIKNKTNYKTLKKIYSLLVIIGTTLAFSYLQYKRIDNFRNRAEFQPVLAEKAMDYASFAWSPNGRQIVYSSRPDFSPEKNQTISIIDLAGENDQVLSLVGNVSNLQWLKNQEIAFSSQVVDPDSNQPTYILAVYNIERQETRILNEGLKFYDFCWSESRQVFALVMWEATHSNFVPTYGDWLMQYDPELDQLNTLYKASGNSDIIDLACDPNSDFIALVEREGDSQKPTSRLIFIDSPVKNSRTIFETSEMKFDSPTWSPDSKWLAVRSVEAEINGDRNIFLIAADGSDARRIITSPTTIEVEWSPVQNLLLVKLLHFGLPPYNSLQLLSLEPYLDSPHSNNE
jgi:hypothetical protein